MSSQDSQDSRIATVVWGTGNMGRAAIRAVAAHPGLELVDVIVNNPDKVGKDAGDLAGLGYQLGVAARRNRRYFQCRRGKEGQEKKNKQIKAMPKEIKTIVSKREGYVLCANKIVFFFTNVPVGLHSRYR